MNTLSFVNYLITVIFTVCYAYQFVYIAVSLLKRHRPQPPAKQLHNYAILICARNEEAVIADLIDSIHRQTYPHKCLQIFVMADNCDDDTAHKALLHGATVYERKNKTQVGKGYALRELLMHIRRDYGSFDGYFVFDADNILAPDYMEQMNKTFSAGHEIVTSYRNSKNYGSNWISAGYALWFLRESRYLNGARFDLGTSCAVSGTGFLFSQRVLEETNYWPFHLLTEDIEFSIDRITSGEKIAFCADAEFYDEQPTDFRQSWHQRMRWSRGYLQVFGKYGGKLCTGVLHGSFSCFDMLMTTMPAFVLSALSVLCNLALGIWGAVIGDDIMIAVRSVSEMLLDGYAMLFILGAITTVTEWRHIRAKPVEKIFYTFTFPLFMYTYVPIAFAAFFSKAEWQPISHTMSIKKLQESGLKFP